LRALVDAVVVGASTIALDNPRLTTRRVAGTHPVRVVIDPRGRIAPSAHIFDCTAPAIVITAVGREPLCAAPDHAGVIGVPCRDGRLDPAEILAKLHARGLQAILVEGGANTVSAFLQQRRIDRLQVAVAPMLLGSGTASVTLPPVTRVDHAIRLRTVAYPLGNDVLFDCTFA
jgi:riboflavin-specific deaminase-like protein